MIEYYWAIITPKPKQRRVYYEEEPQKTIVYLVVGHFAYGCFTDNGTRG